MRIFTTAVLIIIAATTSLPAASYHHRPPPRGGDPMPGRGLLPDAPAPSIEFLSGSNAQVQMDPITNAVLNWYTLGGCIAGGGAGNEICQTNQTINILGGPDPLSVKITTPANIGNVSQAGLQTYNYIDLAFSTPVAAVGMNITDGYRFNWIIGLEAFDINGNSLGKVEENGFDQIQPPTIFNAAIANSDIISSIRIYTPDTGAGCPGCIRAGSIQIHEAPEPATWMMLSAGAGLILIGSRRRRRQAVVG